MEAQTTTRSKNLKIEYVCTKTNTKHKHLEVYQMSVAGQIAADLRYSANKAKKANTVRRKDNALEVRVEELHRDGVAHLILGNTIFVKFADDSMVKITDNDFETTKTVRKDERTELLARKDWLGMPEHNDEIIDEAYDES